MIFAVHPDGNIYQARETLEALEYAQLNFAGFIEKLSTNVSNTLQV